MTRTGREGQWCSPRHLGPGAMFSVVPWAGGAADPWRWSARASAPLACPPSPHLLYHCNVDAAGGRAYLGAQSETVTVLPWEQSWLPQSSWQGERVSRVDPGHPVQLRPLPLSHRLCRSQRPKPCTGLLPPEGKRESVDGDYEGAVAACARGWGESTQHEAWPRQTSGSDLCHLLVLWLEGATISSSFDATLTR